MSSGNLLFICQINLFIVESPWLDLGLITYFVRVSEGFENSVKMKSGAICDLCYTV